VPTNSPSVATKSGHHQRVMKLMNGERLTILDAAVHPLCPRESHDLRSLFWSQTLEIDCASATNFVALVVVPIDAILFITDSLLLWRPISSFQVSIHSRLLKVGL
jgi:hypothetical protein